MQFPHWTCSSKFKKNSHHLLREWRHLLQDSGKNIKRSDLGKSKILAGPLLQLSVRGPQVGVRQEDLLHVVLDLGEQVDELDIRREQQCASHGTVKRKVKGLHNQPVSGQETCRDGTCCARAAAARRDCCAGRRRSDYQTRPGCNRQPAPSQYTRRQAKAHLDHVLVASLRL